MTIELLSYADDEHRRSGSLDWQPVSVRLPRPPRDPFATGTLHTALLARLPNALGLAAGDLERVMVFASPNPAALRVIAYAKGRRFAALDLPLSGPPAKWHALLLKQPAWGSETRTQLFTPNQCCNWPFDGDLEANPVRALRKLAPDSFNLARIRREKERFLTQRQGLGNPSNANPAHVTARFQQLLDQRREMLGVADTDMPCQDDILAATANADAQRRKAGIYRKRMNVRPPLRRRSLRAHNA